MGIEIGTDIVHYSVLYCNVEREVQKLLNKRLITYCIDKSVGCSVAGMDVRTVNLEWKTSVSVSLSSVSPHVNGTSPPLSLGVSLTVLGTVKHLSISSTYSFSKF